MLTSSGPLGPPMSVSTGLEGGWVLLSGGTRGIGRACVDVFAAAGANVVVTSRKQADAEEVARDAAKKHGVHALGLACEVSQIAAVDAAFRQILAVTGGRLDAVVHTATYPVVGEMWDTPLHAMDDAQVIDWFRVVYDADLQGSRLVSRAALRSMLPRRKGSLVFFSSTPALAGYKGLPYTEAKAGILGLTKDLARAYGGDGIRANAIAPGNVRTAWLDDLTAEEIRALEKENVLGRFGEPEELARVCLFLASDLSSFVTGQTLVVDGGTEMR